MSFFKRTLYKIFKLTITSHSAGQAFLQSTILASVPVVFGHLAVLRAPALVPELFPNRPLEKPLASLATNRPVMSTRSPIATHHAKFNRQAHRRIIPILLQHHLALYRLIHFVFSPLTSLRSSKNTNIHKYHINTTAGQPTFVTT